MSTRNAIVLLAILMHLSAFFWSCYQPKDLYSPSDTESIGAEFIQAELQKDEQAEYTIKWEVQPEDVGVDIAISEDGTDFSRANQIGTNVRFDELVYKNKEQKNLYFQLIAGESDTLILSDDQQQICK